MVELDIAAVTLASASAWLHGDFSVGNSIADSPLDTSKAEVIFGNIIGNRESYRDAVKIVLALHAQGCKGMVVHAVGEVMPHRWQRQGAITAYREKILWRGIWHTAHRMIVPPAAFNAWLAKMEKC